MTSPTLQLIATNLVTPCKQYHWLCRDAPLTSLSFQVSLGNDHETKAFYVPELNSNALRASESGDDLSLIMNQLMKAAARAQLVREINVAHNCSLTLCPSSVFPISVGMVPGTATGQVNYLLPGYVFHRD